MSSELDYAEMVKQAEAAVASIKDSELKGIAFGKILDALLVQRDHAKESGTVKTAKRRTRGAGIHRSMIRLSRSMETRLRWLRRDNARYHTQRNRQRKS